jgi:M6 family metalloprotease-like protein
VISRRNGANGLRQMHLTHRARRLLALTGVVAAVAWVARIDTPEAAPHATHADPAACLPPVVSPGGVGEGRNDPRLFPPTVGELRVAMLFTDFADVRSSEDPRAVYEAFVPRTVEWYRSMSYDRLRLVVTPLTRRISLPGRLADYGAAGGGGPEAGLRKIVQDSVAAADAEIDFSQFHAILLVLPWGAVDRIGGSGVLILEQPLRMDGSEIRVFAVLYDGPGAEPDFLTHEMGHVLGLPDLYVVVSPESFHRWDVMASARFSRGLFAWHRWKLGWLEPAQIVCLGPERRVAATLTPLERPGGLKAIMLRRGRYAYVVEVRAPFTFPGNRVCKGGVLIYEVEFGAANAEADIRVLRARRESAALRFACGPQAAAPFGRGRREISSVRAWGLRFEVLGKGRDGSYRIRVTKAR